MTKQKRKPIDPSASAIVFSLFISGDRAETLEEQIAEQPLALSAN
ncbi:hypothetical protein [Xanthomonas translucens]|nr:hypothetical protein [Xanthomonas translucens]